MCKGVGAGDGYGVGQGLTSCEHPFLSRIFKTLIFTVLVFHFQTPAVYNEYLRRQLRAYTTRITDGTKYVFHDTRLTATSTYIHPLFWSIGRKPAAENSLKQVC